MKSSRSATDPLGPKPSRRSFLKQGALAGSSLLFLSGGPRGLRAEPAPAEGPATANDTLRTIHSLRTIHGNFLDKPLPEPDLQEILKASVRAASASNMQSYSIVVVKDRKTMREVCGYRGACMLVYCVDFTRLKATAGLMGYPFFPDNMTTFVTASVNTGLAVQTAAIAARSLGIDSLITNGIHRGDMTRVWKLLDLPATHCFPLIAVVLGYPTEEPAFQKGRLDGPGVIHDEKYHPLTQSEVENLVLQYDDPDRHLALEEGWKAKGYRHYLDWYFKDWLSDSKPTEKETQMLRLLKRSGFVELQKI